ncbi:hypothetical protein JKF63_06101 [Porcisia hertigi]|uniref:Uncharacterized protein n=1 Tax=Porcisia hertigi TaxID=2761500 RepID=A0A836LIU5_9TRYP|nr:hypothetical protein JKF63_06101 [Porcisia hertigi]
MMMQTMDRYTSKSYATVAAGGSDDAACVSARDDVQNTTAASSDWSVRPSDDTTAELASVQTNSLSRLNPAAAPFSFTGVSAAAAAAAASSGDMSGATGIASVHHHAGITAGAGIDSEVTGLAGGARGMGTMLNSKTAGGGIDINSPNSYGMIQSPGMMGMMPYMMAGAGGGAGGHGVMGGGRTGSGGLSNFLPPPSEDTDQQELVRLQQTNYRVKMLPPPLTYEVHRKIWSRNEYGDEDDNDEGDMHGHGSAGGNADQEHESNGGGGMANEDPVDKEQRLEAYKQIMFRWYSHIHVLEGKSEVAKRLVRVRRACPSIDEVIYSLTHPQQPGATMDSEAAGDDESTLITVPPPPVAAAAAARRGSDGIPDTEEILATWSARCWNWWQETVKRKPRRARKQGEMPVTGGNGTLCANMPTSASASALVALNNGGALPHSLSSRNMDTGDSAMPPPPPHLTGGGSGGPYTHLSSYTSQDGPGTTAGMPVAQSYKSFTDLSEEGLDGTTAASGGSFGPYSPHHTGTGGFAPSQHQQAHPALAHDAAPETSMFAMNGPRAATLRGNSEDFLENDHLTLAFTTELLKSLEE